MLAMTPQEYKRIRARSRLIMESRLDSAKHKGQMQALKIISVVLVIIFVALLLVARSV